MNRFRRPVLLHLAAAAFAVWCGGLLRGQDPDPKPTPNPTPAPTPAQAEPAPPVSIVILLERPRPIDEAWLRQTVADIYRVKLVDKPPESGLGNWVLFAKPTSAVRVNGTVFQVGSEAQPWPQIELAVRNVAPAQREKMLQHAAFMELTTLERPVGDAARNALYAQIGKLAARLIGPDSIAIALIDNGWFRPVDPTAIGDLTGDDPLRAFTAMQTAGVVLLRRSGLQLDEKQLRAAAERAFGRPFTGRDKPEAEQDFVMVKAGDAVLRVGDAGLMVSTVDGPVVEAAAIEKAPAAVQELLRSHRAAVLIRSPDRFRGAEKAGRYELLGKLAAELCDDDVVLLNLMEAPALLPVDAALLAKLRGKDPLQSILGER